MAMRTPLRSALRVSRALGATRTRPSLSSRLPGGHRVFAPVASVHTTSPKAQEPAARQNADVTEPLPETPAAPPEQTPVSSLADLHRSLRSFISSGKTLGHHLSREITNIVQRPILRTIDPLTLRVTRIDLNGTRRDVVFDAAYLRDRCPCPQCVSPSSGNKSFSTAEIPTEISYDSVQQQLDGSVHIRWKNDIPRAAAAGHVSVFPADGRHSFRSIAQESPKPYASLGQNLVQRPFRRVYWKNQTLASRLQKIDYADFIAGGTAFAQGAHELEVTGFLFLTNVPHSETAVADIALKFGAIKETFYGRTWDVVSKPEAENVAYTSSYLGLHSDMLYLESPPRIQLLHCLENSCSGGESLFSDALNAAHTLLRENKPAFEKLSNVLVPYHYSANGFFYRQQRPVISLHKGNENDPEVWWSPPFQAPFPATFQNSPPHRARRSGWRKWQAAAATFLRILEEEANMFQYRLQPGECVLFDNRRVLHGRRAFDASSGRRWLKGTYVGNEDFVSTLRSVNVKNDMTNFRTVTTDKEAQISKAKD